MSVCSVADCSRETRRKRAEYCSMHYNRFNRHGDPNIIKQKMHGMSRSKEYQVYSNMRSRCEYVGHPQYKDWGGRGIKVCDRWLGIDGFTNFLEDVGMRPSPDHTLDRRDNDGNYEPDNVGWVTRREQFTNRRFPRLSVTGKRGIQPNGRSFVASASIGGKNYYIGSYKDIDEAVAAREEFIKSKTSKVKQVKEK